MKHIVKQFRDYFQYVITIISYVFAPKKHKKFFIIGVTEMANILYNMKSLFNDDCIVICKNRNVFYENNKYDIDISDKPYVIKMFLSAVLFGKLAKNACLFIYLWNDGLLINRELDFKFLKKRNIPIACFFLGSEIRSRKLFLEYCKGIDFNTYVEYDKPEKFLSDNHDSSCRKLAEQADKYAKIVFSSPIDQMSYIKSKQHYFAVIINENLFSFHMEKFNQLPIKILHAPSNPVLKGTPLVRCIIKMLKNEGYEFQYIELTNKANEEVINELKQSHIVLNQFYALAPGVFGHEAMALGNAVLMSAKRDCSPYTFNNAWLETEDWQLYNNLKFLLDHPEKIMEYAKNGYEYMYNNFTSKEITMYLSRLFKDYGIEI